MTAYGVMSMNLILTQDITRPTGKLYGSIQPRGRTRPGPKVIKLSRVRTHTPNRTPCSKLYSYSKSRGYKTFSYSYSYSSGVQIGDFSSKLHSLLRTPLKAVSAQNAIYNEICRAEFNKCLNYTSLGVSLVQI